MGAASSISLDLEPSFIDQVNRLGAQFHESLSASSLMILQTCWKNAPFPFDQLLTKIEKMSLALEARHIEKAIASLILQIELPETIMSSVQTYLAMDSNYSMAIDALLLEKAPDLLSAAKTHHFLHHSLPHALEIANRANIVFDKLNIMSEDDAVSRFLRKIITIMIQFHDHEQKEKGGLDSVEEVTAYRVARWLIAALGIAESSDITLLIHFLADRVIVLATTMIYSPKRTMDLSELFFELKDVAVFAGFTGLSDETPLEWSDVMTTKAQLMHNLDAMVLITGVCDKNPAVFYDVVAGQEFDAGLSTMRMLSSYLPSMVLKTSFFNSQCFIRPFNAGAPERIDQQAFFLTIIPHISMRCELNRTLESRKLIDFVSVCRKERFNHLDHTAFMEWFVKVSQEMGLTDLMRISFFDNIEKEIHFSQSQRPALVFVANKLVSMRFSPRSSAGVASGHFQPLINPEVPIRDSENLKALHDLFRRLPRTDQDKLVMELFLSVVVQAGEMQVEQYGLNIEKAASQFSFVRTQNQTRFFSSSESTIRLSLASAPKSPDVSLDSFSSLV